MKLSVAALVETWHDDASSPRALHPASSTWRAHGLAKGDWEHRYANILTEVGQVVV